jgi:predicted transcriptional regulator
MGIGAGDWRESISSGRCVDGGRVRLRIENGALFAAWSGAGTAFPEINSVAVLYPADKVS